MTAFDWERFYSFTKNSAPWPLLVRAAALAPRKGRALELGAGAGRDTRLLLEQGFEVTAVDADPHSIALLSALANAHLHVVQSSFEDFDFAAYEPFDLISAQFALPFIPRSQFTAVFTRLKGALAPRGVFAGQFFGEHDQWNTPNNAITFISRAEAVAFLDNVETIELTEEDGDGQIADGSPKHWHVFHVIAQRIQ